MRRTLSWGTLLSLMTASPVALALGLATPRVESSLDAPLQARLALTDIGGLDPSLIKARLATAEAFAQAGIPRTTLMESVRATISRESGGLAVVLTTPQAVHEPYLNLLITLEWPGGQQRQEVTLLLDPPGYAQMPALQPGSSRPLRQDESAATTASSTTPTTTRRDSAVPGQIRVASGDTLWVLADRVRPDGVSIERMMMALQQANPEAFPGGNINRLRAGVTLDVPDRQAILANGENANQRVEQQNRQWQAQRDGGSGGMVTTADGEATAPRTGAGDNAASANGGEAPEGQGQSRLTLLNDTPLGTPQTTNEADSVPTALPAEARERLAELEAQLDDTRQALDQAHAQRDQLADQVGTLREEIQGLREQLDGLLATQAAVGAQSEQARAEQARTEQARTEQAPSEQVQAQQPPAEPLGQVAWRWFSDNMLLLAGAALALLLALWLVVRRRARREEEAADAASRYTAMGGMAGVGAGTSGNNESTIAAPVSARAPSPAPDQMPPAASPEPTPAAASASSQSPLDSAPEAETISEAEIYLAYGRYDQARERLMQSLAADPERHDLRLKLLTACVALDDHDAAEREAAYLDAHGDEQQRAEARGILARLAPASAAAASPESAVPDGGQSPVAATGFSRASESSKLSGQAAADADPLLSESLVATEPVASASDSEGARPAQAQTERGSGAHDETDALAGLADAARVDGEGDGRVIDYQPPSLETEPEHREPELGQPMIDFPEDPLGLGHASQEIEDDHATLADEQPVRGESPPTTDTSGWIVEKVAFDPLDLDNERSTTHASPANSLSAPATAQLDQARQRLDRGEREAARELLNPLLDEDETAVTDEARGLIERHRL